MELRNNRDQSADVVTRGGRQHRGKRYGEHSADSAQSEAPGMHGNSTRENRETPSTPAGDRTAGRLKKAMSLKSNMYVGGESDGRVVPTKCSNKGGEPSAEGTEGRRPTKENIEQTTAPRTQSRTSESSSSTSRLSACGRHQVQGRLPCPRRRSNEVIFPNCNSWETLIQLYDPATTRSDGQGGFTRDPFVGNIIPQDRISTVSKNVLPNWPDPNLPGIINNFIGGSASPTNKNSSTYKVDHRFNSNHSAFFSWTMFNRERTTSAVLGNPESLDPAGEFGLAHKNARFGYTWIISPYLVSQVTLGYNRRNRQNRWIGARAWNQELGIRGMSEGRCSGPAIQLVAGAGGGEGGRGEYQHLGRGTGDPAELDVVNKYMYSGNLSWTRGRHNLKFGGYAEFTSLNFLNPTGCGGFSFAPDMTAFPSGALRPLTGDAFASFLLGALSSAWLASVVTNQ